VSATDDSESDADDGAGPPPARSRKRALSPPVSEHSGRKKAQSRRVDKDQVDEVSPPPAKKPVSAKKPKRVEEPPPGSDSDLEDKKNQTRYVSVKCSDILTGQLISKEHVTLIRQQFQMAMICRDGMDLQDGAGTRALNFYMVLHAARDAKLPKDVCRRFCKAMTDARTAGKEDK
jgi:hypothetical protein